MVGTHRTHVWSPDPRILNRLRDVFLHPGLDVLPVQDEEDGDGGPERAADEAAAQTHLETRGHVEEMLMIVPTVCLGCPMSEGGVLSQPLSREFIVIKVKPKQVTNEIIRIVNDYLPRVIVLISEEWVTPVRDGVDVAATYG